ncbi:MAG: DUF3131 domain-containing protein, partial [Oscillospiraceae bacterium]|nr:DUF3131 domain-containing protein [Oscillospiraceae bacterium]
AEARARYRRKVALLAKRRGECESATARAILSNLHLELSRLWLHGEPNLPPRLELPNGVPHFAKTLVVVSALLTGVDCASRIAARLEEFYLANRDDNLRFCVLADLKEGKREQEPSDSAIIAAAVDRVSKLNMRYGERFYVFTRPRSYAEHDEIWRPWERKRGAILSLCRFLRGLPTELYSATLYAPADVRYLVLLDADTRPGIGSIKKLVGTALHPVNRAVVDKARRVVTRGYGILQPRIGVELRALNSGAFARLFAGKAGTDPYGGLSGDFWQDRFGEGSFNGKGLVDLDAFLQCLDGRLPENQVLSHDLLEGTYLRTGYVGDVEFADGFPSSLDAYLSREHRWIRGDWQLLPFLADRELPAMGKWKITGNLARSLFPIRLDWRSLALLPSRVVNAPAAIATSLWRQFKTRRGLLDWTTSAEQDRRKPPPRERGRGRPTLDREFLLRCAKDAWQYFEDTLTTERGFLPPDNVQYADGAAKVAERTSPTNIGLAMLACVAAADLRLIPRERVDELLDRMLTTVEGLPKWRGHLFNWYDTATREPLPPRFVSTADSGNLACCLIAVANRKLANRECGLSTRARQLALRMEFDSLYDKERELFAVGYDCAEEKLSAGRYDLLISESRLASFFAIASGQVPVKHWTRLGRRGLLSWSGTMFEYFMPALLIPHRRGSLLRNALDFCLREQQRYGEPWGISESAFAELNDSGDYCYKAHGVPRLAIDVAATGSRVVSPYSTFLALPFEPEAAERNLKLPKSPGAYGKYGFCEALDGGTPVNCFMAHHLGMSLTAIANALCRNVFTRRFTREPFIAAFLPLTEEKPIPHAPARKAVKPDARVAMTADAVLGTDKLTYVLKRVNLELLEAMGGRVFAPDGTLLLREARYERGRLRFTPVLAPERDYDAHPAFHKLQIERTHGSDGAVTYRRRAGNSLPPIGVTVGRVRAYRSPPPKYLAPLFRDGNRMERADAIIRDSVGKRGLWKFGISGDFPTLYTEVRDGDGDAVRLARRLIHEHSELRSIGVRYDLIIGTHDGGEYGAPTQRAIGACGDGVYLVDALSPDLPALLAMVDLTLDGTEACDALQL